MAINNDPSKLILVAENDLDISELISTILQMKVGYEVITCENGQEALSELDRRAGVSLQTQTLHPAPTPLLPLPSVILSDLAMPVMDGYTFCQTVRERPLYKNIPIIILAEYSEDLAQDLKTKYFLPKPFGVEKLLASIRQALAAST